MLDILSLVDKDTFWELYDVKTEVVGSFALIYNCERYAKLSLEPRNLRFI
jgi:hypothetical protein